MDNQSGLPPVEEVRSAISIRVVSVPLSECEVIPDVETTIQVITKDGEKPLVTNVYVITTPEVGQYLPSKVWHDENDGFMMLYYISPSLPAQARPFGKGKAYAIVTPLHHSAVLEYRADVRLLVDQIVTPSGTHHFFIFGEDSYKDLIV